MNIKYWQGKKNTEFLRILEQENLPFSITIPASYQLHLSGRSCQSTLLQGWKSRWYSLILLWKLICIFYMSWLKSFQVMALKNTHKTAMTVVITIIMIKFNNNNNKKNLPARWAIWIIHVQCCLKCDREKKTCRKILNVSRQGW